MNKEERPYVDEGCIRTFSPTVNDEELEWHVDYEDRIVTILDGEGWKIQFDEKIPSLLCVGQEIFIKKMSWHRIIKGSGNLIVNIKKLS